MLAVRLGAAHVSAVREAAIADDGSLRLSRSILQGRLRAHVRPASRTVVATVEIGAFGGAEPVPRPEEVLEARRPADMEAQGERESLGRHAAGAGVVDLSGADRIVTAGRGVGGPDEIAVAADLAAVLDAELGASRPVVDSGWLPRERQIGSSGHVVAPSLYVALGVSGSIQHLMGMSGARVIVAVNKDPEAPIFGVAHYGVVGDLHDVAPALTRLLRARRQPA